MAMTNEIYEKLMTEKNSVEIKNVSGFYGKF